MPIPMLMGASVLRLARALGVDPQVIGLTPRQFTTEAREKLAKKGKALPGGGFPIPDVDALKRAVQAIGRAKDPEATKAHIKRAAKRLGREDLIPDDWK